MRLRELVSDQLRHDRRGERGRARILPIREDHHPEVARRHVREVRFVPRLAAGVAEHGQTAIASDRETEPVVDRRAVPQSRPLTHRRGHTDAVDRARPQRQEPAREILEVRRKRIGGDAEEIAGAGPSPAPVRHVGLGQGGYGNPFVGARHRRGQAERIVDRGAAKHVREHAAHARDELVQQQDVDVRVHVLGAGRRAHRGLAVRHVEQVARRRRPRRPDAAQPLDLEHIPEPARHRQELPDRHRDDSGQLGDVAANVVVEPQRAPRRQREHRRRHEGLRDRDDVKPRLRADRDPRLEAGQPDVSPRDDGAGADHRYRDARLVGGVPGQAHEDGEHAGVILLTHRRSVRWTGGSSQGLASTGTGRLW